MPEIVLCSLGYTMSSSVVHSAKVYTFLENVSNAHQLQIRFPRKLKFDGQWHFRFIDISPILVYHYLLHILQDHTFPSHIVKISTIISGVSKTSPCFSTSLLSCSSTLSTLLHRLVPYSLTVVCRPTSLFPHSTPHQVPLTRPMSSDRT